MRDIRVRESWTMRGAAVDALTSCSVMKSMNFYSALKQIFAQTIFFFLSCYHKKHSKVFYRVREKKNRLLSRIFLCYDVSETFFEFFMLDENHGHGQRFSGLFNLSQRC